MKDQRQLQPPDWTEDEGPASTPPVRSALPAKDQRQTPLQQQYPRGRPGESESSSGRTHATGITHPGFYGRKPWKKPNSEVIIAAPETPQKRACEAPFARIAAKSFTKLHWQPFALAVLHYFRQSHSVTKRQTSRRSSAFAQRSPRVEERRPDASWTCPLRSKPRSGNRFSGGSVMPWSSSRA